MNADVKQNQKQDRAHLCKMCHGGGGEEEGRMMRGDLQLMRFLLLVSSDGGKVNCE